MSAEMWKPVHGWEGIYEVSSLGRVRALISGNHGANKAGRILKPRVQPNGYLMVGLYRPETVPYKQTFRSVHSLVLEAFKQPRPAGMVTRHLDRNRKNNVPENLEWGTSKENAADAKAHGTFVDGEKNGLSKLTENEVLEIRRLRDSGITCKTIGSKFGVDWSNVWLIGKRKTWKHVPEALPVVAQYRPQGGGGIP